jgi:lincosamide nucleotidyltransferase A/C/D/E
MMSEQDAVALLKTAEQIGVEVWIDGGWGVDALVGRQTREHNDIDIFIEKKNSDKFVEILNHNGYAEEKTDYTTADHTVWRDRDGRVIDLHLFEFCGKDTLRYDGETYLSNIFDGKGIIGGIPVRCLTAEAQLRFHQGYEFSEKDRHDLMLL